MTPVGRTELKNLIDNNSNFLMVNVLSSASFSDKHIPGSINISVNNSDFVNRVSTVAGSNDRKIVVYCGSRECDASHTAANLLEKAGFSNVLRYEGGLADWEKAGLPVEGLTVAVS
jgi:rhodanese-related sulfurtransferase